MALYLKRAYGGALPTTHLFCLPELPEELQEILVDDILLSSHFREYPPSLQYRRTFWKTLLEKLEAMDQVS